MRLLILSLVALVCSVPTFAAKLSEMRPFKYEVLFTNPVCATYNYDRAVITESGKTLSQKPQNVYCKPADENKSVSRHNAPQYRIVEWIKDKNTKELFLAYLSFSSKNIAAALCEAAKSDVKITIVLDQNPKDPKENKDAEGLKKCGSKVAVYYRGNQGGLGYAHNKILMVNPSSKDEVKLLFSSGNMTGGTSINHENWNFVTTTGKSFFIQDHVCIANGMIEAGAAAKTFKEYVKNCRGQIQVKPEEDIRAYFSPVDKDTFNQVETLAAESKLIQGMSHRFSGIFLVFTEKLLKEGKTVRFMFDDDIYWSAKLRKDIGRNTRFEAFDIAKLVTAGMDVRYLETNQNVYQLQHSKFFIFDNKTVFTGAGNLTTSAFSKNFENFYVIKIPSVAKSFSEQYTQYWDKMSTKAEDMPRDYVMP
ncbi:MAG: phospholipase D-like domain-containing protein [Bacteriovoracaceae bacterium]